MTSDKSTERVSRWHAFDRDWLFRHSIIVFFFTHMVSVANMLFQMVMGWTLSVAEFGILYSMIGLLMVIATPMAAISNTLAHFTANLLREGRVGNIRVLVRQWAKRMLWISVPLLVLLFVFCRPLAAFFHLASPIPLLLVGVALFFSLFSPLFGGVFQGIQAFVLLGFPTMACGLIRPLLGGLLVLAISPVAICGLTANTVSAICNTAVVYFIFLRRIPPATPNNSPPERSDRYFWASFAALFSFSILMNMDVVLVKHYFADPMDYGNYTRASSIGRTIIFLVQPIAGVMFPKVASRGEITKEQKFTFIRSMALTGLMIAGVVLFCTIFPKIPLLILYRDHAPTADMITLVRMVCCAMAPLGLVFLLMNFELAQHHLACVIPLALCAAAFVGGVALFHNSLWQVVFIFLGISLLTLVLLVVMLLARMRSSRRTVSGKEKTEKKRLENSI